VLQHTNGRVITQSWKASLVGQHLDEILKTRSLAPAGPIHLETILATQPDV